MQNYFFLGSLTCALRTQVNMTQKEKKEPHLDMCLGRWIELEVVNLI